MTFRDEQMPASYHVWKAEWHIAMAMKKIKDVTKVDIDRLFGAVSLMTKEREKKISTRKQPTTQGENQ